MIVPAVGDRVEVHLLGRRATNENRALDCPGGWLRLKLVSRRGPLCFDQICREEGL
jgi:hypothetical protein